MLLGQYTHLIDNKKRFSVPSKWRTDLGSKVVVTNGLDNSLFVYNIEEWTKIAQKLSSLSFADPSSRAFTRYMLSNAYEVDIDTAGRILLPDNLKEFAGLNDKVVLAGMYNRFEIWSEASWNDEANKIKRDADKLASTLHELGAL